MNNDEKMIMFESVFKSAHANIGNTVDDREKSTAIEMTNILEKFMKEKGIYDPLMDSSDFEKFLKNKLEVSKVNVKHYGCFYKCCIAGIPPIAIEIRKYLMNHIHSLLNFFHSPGILEESGRVISSDRFGPYLTDFIHELSLKKTLPGSDLLTKTLNWTTSSIILTKFRECIYAMCFRLLGLNISIDSNYKLIKYYTPEFSKISAANSNYEEYRPELITPVKRENLLKIIDHVGLGREIADYVISKYGLDDIDPTETMKVYIEKDNLVEFKKLRSESPPAAFLYADILLASVFKISTMIPETRTFPLNGYIYNLDDIDMKWVIDYCDKNLDKLPGFMEKNKNTTTFPLFRLIKWRFMFRDFYFSDPNWVFYDRSKYIDLDGVVFHDEIKKLFRVDKGSDETRFIVAGKATSLSPKLTALALSYEITGKTYPETLHQR